VDTFRADPQVPADWYRVTQLDYFATGFDRGHMVPNADRDKETSIPINQATFLMSNMIPQSPDNNQGPWADMENDLRNFLPANELYVVAGGSGTGGNSGSGVVNTIANGHITVPSHTWKVVLVLPKDSGDDVARVTAATRTIAVLMPNVQSIRNNDWTTYLTTVDAIEQLTGYDFFENVSDAVENAIEAGVNGVNPPGVANQSFNTDEDQSEEFTLAAARSRTRSSAARRTARSAARERRRRTRRCRTTTAPTASRSRSRTPTARRTRPR
jgi:endonuclease G